MRLLIEIAGKEYTSVLHVVDTVKPVVTAKDVQVCTNETVEPEDLMKKRGCDGDEGGVRWKPGFYKARRTDSRADRDG